MSIRIHTVANRAKTLNAVLAIGCKRGRLDEVNENVSNANKILKSVFGPEELQTLVHAAALQKAAILQEVFSDEIHKATPAEINEMLAAILKFMMFHGSDTLETAIATAMDRIENYIEAAHNGFNVEYIPTEEKRDQVRQSNINMAEAYVKRFLRLVPVFDIDESARSKLTKRLSDPKLRFDPKRKSSTNTQPTR